MGLQTPHRMARTRKLPVRVIALANQKGGVAKTTTSVNLGAALALQGKRVLIIDLDGQHNATTWLGLEPSMALATWLVNGYGQPLVEIVEETSSDRLHAIPSSSHLHGIDPTLRDQIASELLVRKGLENLPDLSMNPGYGYDYVLLDTPPGSSLLTINALAAAHLVIAPVASNAMSTTALYQVQGTVDQVVERLNPDLEKMVVLGCRIDARTAHSTKVHAAFRKSIGRGYLNTYIRENVAVAKAYDERQTIFEYDARSHAAEDYFALGQEVDDMFNKGLK